MSRNNGSIEKQITSRRGLEFESREELTAEISCSDIK